MDEGDAGVVGLNRNHPLYKQVVYVNNGERPIRFQKKAAKFTTPHKNIFTGSMPANSSNLDNINIQDYNVEHKNESKIELEEKNNLEAEDKAPWNRYNTILTKIIENLI